MLLDNYEQQGLLFNMNFKSSASETGTVGYRGELVLVEGEVADEQGLQLGQVAEIGEANTVDRVGIQHLAAAVSAERVEQGREGLWIVRTRFAPGVEVQTHRHTGPVYAFNVDTTPTLVGDLRPGDRVSFTATLTASMTVLQSPRSGSWAR